MSGAPRDNVPSKPGVGTLGAGALRDYWRVLVQRRWIVLAAAFACAAAAGVATFFSTPVFQASTTLQIDRRSPEILPFKNVVGVDPSFASYQGFYQTQYKILQSRAVTRLAVKRMDLLHHPEFTSRAPKPITRLTRWIRSCFSSATGPKDELDPALGFIASKLSIEPIRNSHLVRVTSEDRDPELARDMANAMAEAYLEFNYTSQSGSTTLAAEFLTKEVGRVRNEIDALERELQERSVENEILAISDGAQDISEQALAALNQAYVEARSRLALAEARHQAVRDATPQALPEVLNSPLIISLRQQLAELERRHSQMSERFRDDWPALAHFREELAQAEQQLEHETRVIADQVRSTIEAAFVRASAEVRNLKQQVDLQKSEVQRVNRDTIEVASLRAEIETKRRVLANLIARQSETETTDQVKDTRTSNIRIVDVAETPQAPIRPNRKLNLLLGLVMGLGLGVGAAFLLDHLDNTIKNEQEIQRFGDLTVLGHLPLIQPLSVVEETGPTHWPNTTHIDMASHVDPKSHFAEACRSIRTALLLASPEHPPRSIVITSCEPSDGKSTTALNLAIVLAQLGRRVLILDADLRRPRLHKALGLENRVGLSSFLSGNAEQDQVILETEIPNVNIIPSGPLPPNPSELLDSAGLKNLLSDLQRDGRYDHIVIDSPPLLHVTDTVLLAIGADASIVVVRGGKTRRESLAEGTQRLRLSRSRVIGAVLNAVSQDSGYYSYGRYRGYQDGSSSLADDPPPGRATARAMRGVRGIRRRASGG